MLIYLIVGEKRAIVYHTPPSIHGKILYPMKHVLRLFIVLLVIFSAFLFYFGGPSGVSDETIRFVVPLESKQGEIKARLKKEGFIRSEKLFDIVIMIKKPLGEIEPGAYRLTHRMSVFSLTDMLLNHPYQRWIVLVPGLRVEQIAERLAKKFQWDEAREKEFVKLAPEGYMFPDTYLLNTDSTPKEMADRMMSTFNEKFDRQLQKDLLSQDVRNDTAIKIASLIERESGGDEDKSLIAGIIWNRLDQGMRLQIDATVQYALGHTGDWWPRVSVSDYRLDSPYNTYLIKGLPPSPIANPSLASIKAVIYPEETDCLFYLHAPDKKIYCSKTYEEHLENIERYLKTN